MPGYSNGNEINLQFVENPTGFELSAVTMDNKPETLITNKEYGSGNFKLQDKLAPWPVTLNLEMEANSPAILDSETGEVLLK